MEESAPPERISIDLPFDLFSKYNWLYGLLGEEPQEVIENVLESFFREKLAWAQRMVEAYSTEDELRAMIARKTAVPPEETS